ncbi:hypothetical protein HAHE_35270 [Haloferula helveola]|uniref:Glycoside-hydrolase family GH114 TIM-barrel domain-containing protein n=1 Tax=Haloferula helveola TaxID=490095 RepID=A0ABM7RD55_9BACT|nr:hypothetical protein HAHE_35270 [Haloferula helveola]
MTLPRPFALLLCTLPLLAGETPRPTFSWDRVPVYQMFGSNTRLLTDEEVEHISDTTDFLCIEKQHGARLLRGSDRGAAHEFARFKRNNPDATCLFYFNSAFAYPFASGSRSLRKGNVPPHLERFLIRDPKTGELADRGNVLYFDVLNPGLRKWWSSEVGRYIRETGADGLFVDQMHGFSHLRPREKRPDVRTAQAEMMRMAKEAIGPDKILLLNNGAHIPELFAIGDAFMFEHYSTDLLTKEAILRDWNLMRRIADAGKSSVWRIGVEVGHKEDGKKLTDSEYQQLARQRLPYYLAAFLAGACEYSYFQYGWGWGLETGPLMDYPEMKKPLGKPLGERRRPDPHSWVFLREFEHASVRVDLEKKEGSVTWK